MSAVSGGGADPGQRANFIGLGTNALLAVGKLTVGLTAGSDALIADGFNSAGDVLATAIGAIGYRLGRVPPDHNHPYGHGNAETVAGLVIGAMLLGTGAFIALNGVLALLRGKTEAPGVAAVWAAGVTALVKEVLYRYTHRVGARLNSPALLASARDHRSDVLSAVAVAGGVLAARLGLPWLDPLAAVIIGLAIVGLAVQPLRHNFGVLMDESNPELGEQVRALASAQAGVLGVEQVRVHTLGSYHIVDFEICADAGLSLREAHELAHQVGDAVRAGLDHVQEVRVHVNPAHGPDR